MPTPPRSYSPSAAEKLRFALLALAASATVAASAQDVPDDAPAETDVLGEIPEDFETGGDIGGVACPKKGCDSEDCWCDGPCEEGKPCTDCDDEEPGDDPEPPEGTSGDDPAVFVGGEAPTVPAPEPMVRGEAPGLPVRDSSATNAPAYSIAVETLSRALSAQAGYPIFPELIVQSAKAAEMEPEEFAREKLSELGIEPGEKKEPPAVSAPTTNAPANPPPARLGGRRYSVPRTNP